jgi:restriction endonuclease S subunit
MSNLNRGIIENCEIPFPPLSEQQRIVAEIESRLSQAEASETYIENALQQAEALRQSILKKAFSGELVVSTGSTTANCG